MKLFLRARQLPYFIFVIGSVWTLSTTPALAQVAFSELGPGGWRVHVADRIGRAGVQPMISQSDQNAPALSPSSEQVAFELAGGSVHVCMVKEQNKCRRLGEAGDFIVRPVWRPKSDQLYVVRYDMSASAEDSDVMLVDPKTNELRLVLKQTGNQDYPDFSADGRFMVYSSAQLLMVHRSSPQLVQNLWLVDLMTGRARRLTHSNAEDIHADWSPDGQKVAFSSNRNGQFEIYTVKADGNDVRKITSGAGAKYWPTWSPNGKEILYTLMKKDKYGLWVSDLSGGKSVPYVKGNNRIRAQRRDGDWR